jgi:transcriptional regulator with XRE-family HTH domain
LSTHLSKSKIVEQKGDNAMTTTELFASNLRNQLFAKKRTQSDLARALKTSPTTVSRWVNAEQMPRSATIDKICVYLHCTSEDLMADHSKPVQMLPEDVLAEEMNERPRLFRLMFIASKMSDENLDALIQIAEKMK